ncbi:hypothetical protein [Phenylobacterium deserti]|uniref:Lipoprotein n=1 Tax=Phenylobacterium deserti TaxID=1914756 RepID=A0A328ANJ3_9CAUL|nr:hypothetical protein [Phenylobacterium deserti]RAK56510.1 hypothetical protein DJ018_00555 [Phenylobacterium deserti]
MNRRIFLIAAAAALSGCATTPPTILPPPGAPLAELEPLYAVAASRDGLTITVSSNGCTRKDDFAFYLDRRATGPTLSFGRKRLDPCRAFAAAKADLMFNWDELGLERGRPVFLMNPVTAWAGP